MGSGSPKDSTESRAADRPGQTSPRHANADRETPALAIPADLPAILAAVKRRYVVKLGVIANRLEVLAREQRGDSAWDEVQVLVHRLAGSAGSHGLDEISTLAAALDAMLTADDGRAVSVLADLISLMRVHATTTEPPSSAE